MRKLLFALVLLIVITAAYAADIGDFSSMLKDPPQPAPSAHVPQEVVVASAELPQPAAQAAPPAQAAQQPKTIIIEAKPELQQQAAQAKSQPQEIGDLFGDSLYAIAEPAKISIEDNEGNQKPAKINKAIKPKTKKKTNLTTQGNYTVYLNLTPTKRLLLENATITSNTTIRFEEVPYPGFENSIAIDLSGINFGRATYTAVAKKFELYKCRQWNFTTQDCDGSWAKIRNLVPGAAYSVELGPDDPSLAEGGGLFYDGFENGFEYNNWTINGTGNVWIIASHDPYNGTYHAEITQSGKDNPSSMIVNVSTVGYSSIGIHFMRRLVGIDTADQYIVRWYNGTNWKTLEQVTGSSMGDPYYVPRDHILDSSASNNPKFALEFMCMMDANVEHCHIDELRITNDEPVPAAEMGCGLFFDGFESGLSTNWTVNGTGVKWVAATTNPYNGTRHANAQKTGRNLPTSMIINISTMNFTSPRIRYARRRVGIDAADEFRVSWFNGSTWNTLEETATGAANDAAYVIKDFFLNGTGSNKTIRLEFMCMADATGEACRVDDICVNASFAGDKAPPTVWWTNISSTTPSAGDSMCFLAYVTDAKSAVKSVIARIRLPNGTNTTLQLHDDLTCNSPENDSIYSNYIIVPSTGNYNWTFVNATDALSNSGNVPVGRTFVGMPFAMEIYDNIPPNLSRYNNATLIPLALINTSNNVYATQNLPKNTNTYMYFNWTLNITGEIGESNVSIEHSYSATSGVTADLQIKNGTAWQNLCFLTVSTSDTTDVCSLDAFVNGNVSVLNGLELRTNVGTGGQARIQSVDHTFLRVVTLGANETAKCGTLTSSKYLAKNLNSAGTCFVLNASNIFLDCRGYTITGNGAGSGVRAIARQNVTIRNCRITDFFDGINLTYTTSSLVHNNTIWGNDDDGIDMDLTNITQIELNNLSANYDNNIVITASSSNNISNNTIALASGDTFSAGIVISNNSNSNRITNNTVRQNQNDGIFIELSSQTNTINQNTVSNNGEDGIDITDASSNIVQYNNVANNSEDGVEIARSNYTIAGFNNITNSNDAGIEVHNTVNNNITANLIIIATGVADNGGIELNNSAGNRIINNSVQLCTDNGILLRAGSENNTVVDNTFERNSNDGISIQSSAGNNITLNIVKNNEDDGIYLERANYTLIERNTVLNNSDDGIYLTTGSSHNTMRANTITNHTTSDSINIYSNTADLINNTILSNTIERSGDNAVQALNRTHNLTIFNNTIIRTGIAGLNGEGMYIRGVFGVNITRNNFTDINGEGIYASYSADITIAQNSIKNTSDRFISSYYTNTTLVNNNTIFTNDQTELRLYEATDATILDSVFKNYSFTNAGLTFRNTGEGEIVFLDRSISRVARNLSFDLRIGNNSIFVNDSNAAAFNTSANITIFNQSLPDVTIEVDYRDNNTFVDCPATICALIENNELLAYVKFNVTGFSTYRVITSARVYVINLTPVPNSEFLINATISIAANVTTTNKNKTIDRVFANITKPDGSSIAVQLTNLSKDIYNATISGSDIYLRGKYNITFFANDTGSRSNSAVKVPFIRRSLGIIDIIDINGNLLDAGITVIANNSGVLDLDVNISSPELANGPHNLVISNHDPSSPNGMFRQGYDAGENLFLSTTDSAIDLSLLNFSSISFTKKAAPGYTLLKCAYFNYTSQTCIDLCPDEPNCSIQEKGLWLMAADASDDGYYHFELLNATDPGFGEYNTSQRPGEINTTSSTPVTAIQLNMTPASATYQHILFGYAELAGYAYGNKFCALLSLNDTSEIGRLNYTAVSTRTSSPPGYYPQFYTQKLVNLNANNNNLSVQFCSLVGGTTTFIRRATGIAVLVNNNDALTNDSGDTFTPLTTTGTDIRVTNLSFTPPVTQNLLVLASAEYMPVSTTNNYMNISLKINNTESGNAYTIATAANDVMMFGTHKMIFNATAGVQQNFTIVTRVDTTSQIRRARIIVMPVDEFYYNASENSSYTTSATPQNKTCINFNLSSSADVLALGSAELTQNSFKVTDQPGAQLILDNLVIGNTTLNFRTGLSLLTSMAVGATNLSAGSHRACLAFRSDAGTATKQIKRGRITIIPMSRPDLFINSSYINFNDTNPNELQNITINATVFNLGYAAAPNVLVNFWDGINCTGAYIGNYTISPVLLGGQNATVNITYVSVIGNRTISVCVDPYNRVQDSNRSNNNASRTLNVKSTTLYFGSLNGSNITLDNAANITNYNFGFNNSGNIYFFYVNSTFNFTNLQALGRNSTGGATTNDFWDADYNLNSTFFNDSVRKLWANWSNGTPITTRTFEVYNNTIQFVPIINSTNNSIFVTGILWDTQDDTNGQYDTTDNEDLVFVGLINQTYSGIYGLPFDYEIRIATLLRSLRGALNRTAYIAELQ